MDEDIQRRIREIISEIEEKSASGDYIYRGEPKHYKKVSSTLYRQYEDDIEAEDFDIEVAQNEMLTEAKDYIHETDEGFEILTQLQHFGGKTNLIDFTTDYLIALFFACESLFDKPGRVILLDESAQEANRAKKPRNTINRVRDQKSIFARPLKGFIEIEPDDAINIPKDLKQPISDYLKKYHDISTKTIYNDLHGFIRNQGIHEGAYARLYKGFTGQKRGDQATTSEEKQQEYEKSIEYYTQAIRLNPNHAPTYYNCGNAHSNLGDYNSAIGNYTHAIAIKPDFVAAYYNRGVAYGQRDDYERAIADYTKAIELNSNDAHAYYNRGLAYGQRDDYERAIADYTKAIELNSNDAHAYYNRGVAYGQRDDYERAIADYTKAINIKSDFAAAYNNRDAAQRELERLNESL